MTALAGAMPSDTQLEYGAWVDYSPSLTGWSANPTNTVYRYFRLGKLVIVQIVQNTAGTSNATTKTIDLPFQAKSLLNAVWSAPFAYQDSGTDSTAPGMARCNSNDTTISFITNYNLGLWTASGSAKIKTCMFTYECA